jgi:hypothetical protein
MQVLRAVILSRADDEGSQVGTPVDLEILRCAQDDGFACVISIVTRHRRDLIERAVVAMVESTKMILRMARKSTIGFRRP